MAYLLGSQVAEGKTKIVKAIRSHPGKVWIESKDDITAGDGARHDSIPDKARLANETTCNVFRHLRSNGIPVAFHEQVGMQCFVAESCQMLPYEVVVRREAHGSYLKRFPELAKATRFEKLFVEFFLKTSGKMWNGNAIPCDDPLMIFENNKTLLYLPNKPVGEQTPFMIIDEGPPPYYEDMQFISLRTFEVLEKAWSKFNYKLVDFKVEFGLDSRNRLLLADVIDNDSWRLVYDDEYMDKQVYRDGGDLEATKNKYEIVAEKTRWFNRDY